MVLAGDWNATPRDIEESSFPRETKAVSVAPPLPTCITPKANQTSDFFAANVVAKRLLESVSVDAAWAKRPRRPVVLGLS
eukprot:2453933-Pyramimonas_sp.AAC.1